MLFFPQCSTCYNLLISKPPKNWIRLVNPMDHWLISNLLHSSSSSPSSFFIHHQNHTKHSLSTMENVMKTIFRKEFEAQAQEDVVFFNNLKKFPYWFCRLLQLHNLTVQATACAQYLSLALTSSGWSPEQITNSNLNVNKLNHTNSSKLCWFLFKFPHININISSKHFQLFNQYRDDESNQITHQG